MSGIRMFAVAVVLGLGVAVMATAQTVRPAQPASRHAPTTAAASNARSSDVVKPGDRDCIRDTGSLIPAKKDRCLQGVFGRSYSGKELRATGQQNTADALRMLDPAIH